MRGRAAWALGTATVVLAASPLLAQSVTPGPPGRYVLDIRVVSMGLPKTSAFFPPVPAGTIAPARTLGFDIGGHVIAGRWKATHFGLGVDIVRARGSATSTPPSSTSTTSTTPVITKPDIEATITSIVPQLTLNFGSRDGWSYVAAGYGGSQLRTATLNVPLTERVDSGRISTFSIAGGARWFFTSRLAIGFDLRLNKLSASSARSTPAASLLSASVGLSLR